MSRKVLVGFGVTAAMLFGAVQFASKTMADRPIVNCAAVLCIQCPDGYVLSPTPGNCCRCVKAR